ncbi:MAG: argininosuccinate lyase [Arenicellales bacterium]|tara:strand:- start:1784 stop:3169 length:1386 start_codon:yes stop_codon:yes gene_type:complete
MGTDKLWGGRFSGNTDATVEAFTASEHFDRRLAQYDIEGSRAHALMLHSCGIISEADGRAIIGGLDTILQEISADRFQWSAALEDVHMNIEARLTELVGDPGKKLHTARSRNDQVATDLRLFTRDAIDQLQADLTALQRALVELAEGEAETIMPGMTHMQTAQPVTCGHHLLAWNAMLERDWQRLADCRRRVNVSPLGVAALAGTSFPVDRNMTAVALGFDGVSRNSLDAVSDRDFVVEFCGGVALLMVHLSRMAEELVLWASQHLGFVDLGDAFCTGSSIMPQKKNPDVAELVRGRSGRAVGNLASLLVLMKGQPLAYNRDNQEDKQPLFDSFDNAHACLVVMAAMVPNMTFNRQRMREAAGRGHATATDLADYLVRRGLAFRDAHEAVGKAVQLAESAQRELDTLSLDELRGVCELIDEDVFEVLTLEGAVYSRNHVGGTSPDQVRQAVVEARQALDGR